MMVLMTLAHVVEEHQNDLLASHSDVMGFLLEQLALAWDSERHHHDFFCVEELLHALRYLAKLDSNKTALLEKGHTRVSSCSFVFVSTCCFVPVKKVLLPKVCMFVYTS